MPGRRTIIALTVCANLAGAGAAAASILDEPPASPPKSETSDKTAPAAEQPAQTPKPLSDAKLLEIVRTYSTWQRVTDHANFAPALCRPALSAGVQHSVSTDSGTHGKKLYFLYAAKPNEYTSLDSATKPEIAPVSQTIVKETFVPVEIPLDKVPAGTTESLWGGDGRTHPREYIFKDGKAYKTGDKRELFVMTKLDPATPNTDKGWVYATLTADGSKVLHSGMIASCMGCHEQTLHDRQFGLPRAQVMAEHLRKQLQQAKTEPAAPTK